LDRIQLWHIGNGYGGVLTPVLRSMVFEQDAVANIGRAWNEL
jgi:hypothetical protein